MSSSDFGVISALVPARGGSKGILNKNLAEVGGLSLVARAVKLGRSVSAFNEVYVSSDSDAVLSEARAHGGVAIRRRDDLATDTTSMRQVIVDFLSTQSQIDVLVVLQPTSPLRSPADVKACIAALEHAPSATTITKRPHPAEWIFSRSEDQRLVPVLGWEWADNRQEAPATYELNGAVYAFRSQYLLDGGPLVGPDCVGVEMPRRRAVDVDDPLDLELARCLVGEAPPSDIS